jgi:hypothetical protein
LLIANKTSVPVLCESNGRIFDAPRELYHLQLGFLFISSFYRSLETLKRDASKFRCCRFESSYFASFRITAVMNTYPRVIDTITQFLTLKTKVVFLQLYHVFGSNVSILPKINTLISCTAIVCLYDTGIGTLFQ